jgi:hypothetical protein
MLLRLVYFGVTNAFAMLRLLSMSDRDRVVEILALRHQITVLERQLGGERVRFTPTDRAFLAALLHRLPRDVLRELLDRTLIWNQRHLLHALCEFEKFYNSHRPHQGIANARPLNPLPAPIADPAQLANLDKRRSDRLGGILHEYEHAA